MTAPDSRLWTDTALDAATRQVERHRFNVTIRDWEIAEAVLDAVTPLIAARVRRQAAADVAELRQAIRPPSATWDRGWYDALTAASVSLRRTSPDSGTAPPTDHDAPPGGVTTSSDEGTAA